MSKTIYDEIDERLLEGESPIDLYETLNESNYTSDDDDGNECINCGSPTPNHFWCSYECFASEIGL